MERTACTRPSAPVGAAAAPSCDHRTLDVPTDVGRNGRRSCFADWGRPIDKVFLFHSCDHLPNCYPLNRFVALLVGAFVHSQQGRSSILGGSRLRAARPVAGSPHSCGLGCWGHPHEVELEHAPTCFGTVLTASQHLVVDGLVVRHGINKHSSAGWIRHILPRDIV